MIILGEEQEKALSLVQNFILNDDSPAFLLCGAAGTGKTATTNELIQWLQRVNIPYTLCAPTHKAALVLSRATEREAITIHSLLALSPKLDIFALDFNNLLFHSKTDQTKMCYKGLVICDEASMINDDLYELLLRRCQEFQNKILFLADFKQIQPVNQDSLSKIVHTIPCFTLNKIWRQSEKNALLPILSVLREHSVSHFDEALGEEGSLYVTSDPKEFIKQAGTALKKGIKDGDILETKVLCYTNDRVRAYNELFHKGLFGNKEYYKGEFLIGCENVTFAGFKFYNSMDYIVCSEPQPIMINIPNFGQLPGFNLELYDSLTNDSEWVPILSKEISRDYFDALGSKIEDYRQKAVSYGSLNKAKAGFFWRQYYAMINSFASPIDFYYEGRLIRKKTFDYSYAITTHRSQGSSLSSVFVDMRNINGCADPAVHRQLQYVALSRTRKNVLIYQ